MIKIDKEFESLIPPLSSDEFKQLEENCVNEGIRDALIVWKNGNEEILIDGHNRYKIANKHNLSFETETKEFDSRNDAMMWVIRNQLGRRNLSAYDRSVLALKLKPLIAEKAKETQGTRNDICQKSDKSTDTKKELAAIAGVSHDTIHKVEVIEKKATPELKKKIQSGETSINKGYSEIKKVEAIEKSDNDYLKQQVRSGKTTIDQAFRIVTGTNDKSPAKMRKEFIEETKKERDEFREKKSNSVISLNDVQADKRNKSILAKDMYVKLLHLGDKIDQISLEIKTENTSISELSSEWTEDEKKELNFFINSWIQKLSKIKGEFN